MIKQPKSAFKTTDVIHTGGNMILIILLQPGSLATSTYNSRIEHSRKWKHTLALSAFFRKLGGLGPLLVCLIM